MNGRGACNVFAFSGLTSSLAHGVGRKVSVHSNFKNLFHLLVAIAQGPFLVYVLSIPLLINLGVNFLMTQTPSIFTVNGKSVSL